MATTALQPSVLATRRGKLTLVVLCAVAFLDFIDASIVNLALPAIRGDLHMSVQSLQWIPSGYLLTYGGLMLLGGRAADLLGRRRVLVTGTILFAAASLAGGLAGSSGVLIGARLAQGAAAAMMLPAALSILTTTFREGADRVRALGAWGGMAGLGSAAGVLLGGVLTQSSTSGRNWTAWSVRAPCRPAGATRCGGSCGPGGTGRHRGMRTRPGGRSCVPRRRACSPVISSTSTRSSSDACTCCS